MDLYETNTGYHLGVDESDGIGADMVGHHTYEEAAEAGIQAACRYIIDHFADARKKVPAKQSAQK